MRQNENGRVDEPARTDGLTKESIDSDYSKTFAPGEGVRGRLLEIIEPDGDFAIASVLGTLYEIQRGDQVRAGRCSCA